MCIRQRAGDRFVCLAARIVALAHALLAGLASAGRLFGRLRLILGDDHRHRVDRHLARLRRRAVDVGQPRRILFVLGLAARHFRRFRMMAAVVVVVVMVVVVAAVAGAGHIAVRRRCAAVCAGAAAAAATAGRRCRRCRRRRRQTAVRHRTAGTGVGIRCARQCGSLLGGQRLVQSRFARRGAYTTLKEMDDGINGVRV